MSRSILNNLLVTLLLLLSWGILGGSQAASVSGHHLSVSELLKFAGAFGAAEASNETIESVRQGFFGPKPNFNDLAAFEENRYFVYAMIKPSEAVVPGSPRLTRRLIFLKPSTFVVDDEIDSGSSSGGTEWSLDSPTSPRISGRVAIVSNDGTELVSETLLPEMAAIRVKRQSGYALQVNAKQPSKTVRFLHVLHMRRRGDGSTGTEPIAGQRQ